MQLARSRFQFSLTRVHQRVGPRSRSSPQSEDTEAISRSRLAARSRWARESAGAAPVPTENTAMIPNC